MATRFSIIMEYENATTHEGDEAAPIFAALLSQFAGREPPVPADRDELILVFDPSGQDGEDIDRVIREAAPTLVEWLDIKKLARPGMRYYELKNAGAEAARGEILIFLDSDLEPEDRWLATLTAPFRDPGVTAVNGYTYLGHHDFLSRTLALTWMFPLREDSPREMRRRPLHANNWAVRREWFLRNQFPNHPGFKVSCSLLTAEMKSQGIELVKVQAYGRHKPLEGFRFVMWRGATAGRDDDARFATMHSESRMRRLARACSRWVKHILRSARRVATRYRSVGMPAYQVVPAIIVAWLYYTIFFAAQVGSALSGPRRRPDRIPAFVLRH